MRFVFDQTRGTFDIALTAQGGIDSGIGNGGLLESLIWTSIFTDALCSADDLAADPTLGTDRRGAWMDNVRPTGVPMGSLLWTYRRSKKTEAVRLGIQNTVQAAVQWIQDDGLVTAITVAAAWLPDPLEGVRIRVTATEPPGIVRNWEADDLWNGIVT